MSYNILTIRHSAQSVIGNSNTTTQYDGPMVAATAICGGRLVCSSAALRALASPGLSLFARSPKASRVAARARTQSRIHGQPASATDSSSTSPLPRAKAANQPGSSPGIGAMVTTELCPWLRAPSIVSSNVFFNTVRTAVPQPSWPRFTKSWHPTERAAHNN